MPSYIENTPVMGWNAGANSIDEIDGDLHVVTDMPSVVGVIVGLKSGRNGQALPALVEHGFYLWKLGQLDVVQVIERGVVKNTPVPRSLNAQFEIRRTNGRVRYLVSNSIEPMDMLSDTVSFGPKIVNACLYATGDAAPSGVG